MNCKSCLSEISKNNRFCPNCGSKIVDDRLSIKGTWEEFIGPFFSWDNNFWRTFIGLFKNPKDVLEAYINGARKKYFNPFSYLILFATIAVIFYKIFPMGGMADFSEGFNQGINANDPSAVTVPKMDMKAFMANMMNYYNFYYILMIPIISFITYLTFYKQKNNFPEHLVFNSYIQTNLGFISLILQVLFFNIIGLSFLYFYVGYTILSMIYATYAFKKLYVLNSKQAFISVLKFWAILIPLYVVVSILGAIIAVIFMIATK